jgi:elongator complex protein 3
MINVKNEPRFYQDIMTFIREKKPSRKELANEKLRLGKIYGVREIPTTTQILRHAPEEDLSLLTPMLVTKPVRTQAGVAVVAIMTAPHACPHGKCTYCPGGPGSYFGDVPQSYTGNEPATMRGIRNNYSAYLQVMNRLEQYLVLGQPIDKIEIIVMGGTFSAHPLLYKQQFIAEIYQACNDFSAMFFDSSNSVNIRAFKQFFELPGMVNNADRTARIQGKLLAHKNERTAKIVDEQVRNEQSRVRVVALCIETKPDWCKKSHINEMLAFGTTRVELGVQTLKESVLLATHRGHALEDTKQAMQLLRDALLKVTIHMMPGLPDTTREEDIDFFKELFSNPAYRPDALKIYPCMVMPGTKLEEDFREGRYQPLSTTQAASIIAEASRYVEPYCRIMRVQRDIPTKLGLGGVDKNNLRQLVDSEMQRAGIACKCIRCREAQLKSVKRQELVMKRIDYAAGDGEEVFLSFETADGSVLAGFCRLRRVIHPWRPEFSEKTAGIRELHIYSRALQLGATSERSLQHQGLGKELMAKAEQIAREEWGCNKILVISGVGVRPYYQKRGYAQEGPYMGKKL